MQPYKITVGKFVHHFFQGQRGILTEARDFLRGNPPPKINGPFDLMALTVLKTSALLPEESKVVEDLFQAFEAIPEGQRELQKWKRLNFQTSVEDAYGVFKYHQVICRPLLADLIRRNDDLPDVLFWTPYAPEVEVISDYVWLFISKVDFLIDQEEMAPGPGSNRPSMDEFYRITEEIAAKEKEGNLIKRFQRLKEGQRFGTRPVLRLYEPGQLREPLSDFLTQKYLGSGLISQEDNSA